MTTHYYSIPKVDLNIDTTTSLGPFEWWRHCIGHGGVNSKPLPQRVITGAKKLHPRLLRTFIQEYHGIYPEHNVYDWSRLDPYMESLAASGAQVVAAITIKPGPLYPEINQRCWQPTDWREWQQVIEALVRRYSVDRQIVSHWEVGNETDIGESGGCPYLIDDPQDYFEYYRKTCEAILAAFPSAQVGGPALANVYSPLMPGLITACLQSNTPLDFVSWHIYSNDSAQISDTVKYVQDLLTAWPAKKPETFITEFSTYPSAWPPHGISIEEQAFHPSNATRLANDIFAALDAGLDWSFYYHIWDQTAYYHEFAPFFENPTIMPHHWNEMPHRLGLFGVEERVRPQYFLYQLLSRMGHERIAADGAPYGLQVRATRDEQSYAILVTNVLPDQAQDHVLNLRFTGLTPGTKILTVYRIDQQKHWDEEELTLLPFEQREVDTSEVFSSQVLSPADSVVFVSLSDKL